MSSPDPDPPRRNGTSTVQPNGNSIFQESRQQASFLSQASRSSGGSTNRTIYFENQRAKKIVEDDEEEFEEDPTYWERFKENWGAIAIISFLFTITVICAVIEVSDHHNCIHSSSQLHRSHNLQDLRLPACGVQSIFIGLVSIKWEQDSILASGSTARTRAARIACQSILVSIPLAIGAVILFIWGILPTIFLFTALDCAYILIQSAGLNFVHNERQRGSPSAADQARPGVTNSSTKLKSHPDRAYNCMRSLPHTVTPGPAGWRLRGTRRRLAPHGTWPSPPTCLNIDHRIHEIPPVRSGAGRHSAAAVRGSPRGSPARLPRGSRPWPGRVTAAGMESDCQPLMDTTLRRRPGPGARAVPT